MLMTNKMNMVMQTFLLETIDYQGWFLAKWGWQGDGLLSQSNLGGRKMTPSANKEGGLG